MNEIKQRKMSLKRGVSLTLRGFGIIRKLFPGYMTLAFISSFLKAVQPLVVIYFSARVIDELAGARGIAQIAVNAGIVVGAAFLVKVIVSLITRRLDVFESTLWYIMQYFKGERYACMDFKYVEDSRINEMLADIRAKEQATGLGIMRLYWLFPRLIENLIGVLASAALMAGMFSASVSGSGGNLFTSKWGTIILVALIALPILLRVVLMKRSGRIFAQLYELIPKTNTIFAYYYRYIDVDGAGKDIRIYNQQQTILALLKQQCYSWLNGLSRVTSETAGITAAANAVVSGFAYILIGLRALYGMYGIGPVTQYVGAVTSFSGSLTGLISTMAMMWESAVYLPVLYEFLDLPDFSYPGTLTTEKRTDGEYEIEFHNVSFKYPGSEQYALKNLNLKLNIGKRLAVVGMNGSGKTTMIKLLCRLYDPTAGYITLNGIDIKKYDYNEYTGIFSVVFQDFELLAFSLAQNVAAAVDYDEERVKLSLNKVGFNWRAPTLQKGLDTVLYKSYEESGVTISGGEAQKIALARAIYKNAPFIVLDEPTAALDPIAEFEIYSKFDSIVGGKTAIYISHRLSSCRFCDDIAVFHEGKLIQRGSHEQLLSITDGKYFELWNAQAQHYAATGTP
ncbi:MAG: ABC transporter ATP-binding protein [Clostridiales bacterium]|nr:ABC transporter ATP-binding protein [Clostridiales bacterium]